MQFVLWSQISVQDRVIFVTMDLKKIQDVDKEALFGAVFGVSGPGKY